MASKQSSRHSGTQPLSDESLRAGIRNAKDTVEQLEKKASNIRERLHLLRRDPSFVGRASGEEALRDEYAHSFEEERRVLSNARDPERADTYDKIDNLIASIDTLEQRNRAFRARLDVAANQYLDGVRTVLAAERVVVAKELDEVTRVDQEASRVRDRATTLALEKVRRDLNQIVVRADVGLVDVAFARKQQETEKIGKLQRAKAGELTDLNQAFADLQKDEVQ
jgi:hypothetical protein